MSRKIKYTKPYMEGLWSDFQASGKKLKEYCKTTNGEDGKPLNYISIYTALRKNDIMQFLKKKAPAPEATAPVETPPQEPTAV
jgi:hypothetical protein